MLNDRQRLGQKSESIATQYLKRCNYRIVEQNYRTKLGEIDIIARDGDTIVFVEVRARNSVHFGHPKESITFRKMKTISKTALLYLKQNSMLTNRARFDVLTVTGRGKERKIELFKNAFPMVYP